MPQIHILDEPTINQIAAGEVVERPSAVVKELIENAMDAGATAITCEIKEGGLSFIRITDNGSGIAREDIPLAFLRHATSKIRTAEDLLAVTSLGFRGEALSSIAAVSQLELITKTPAALNGFRYLIEGGEEKSLEEIGCPGGSTIIVRNLFYNTPARRKFLKSPATEAGYVSDLMERLMVSHPEVSFKFIMNNQVKLQSSGNHNSKDILYQVYGRDITKELLTVEYSSEDLKITGYIGKPVINRGNRNYENYFINGRYIKSNIITKAIEEAYRPFLMQHKYPFTSLYFEITPSLIDVNVHPQKMEIRLNNGEEVYQKTWQAIRNALTGKEMIPKVLLTPDSQEKQELPSIPEPFEENRRKQLQNQNISTTSNVTMQTNLQRAERGIVNAVKNVLINNVSTNNTSTDRASTNNTPTDSASTNNKPTDKATENNAYFENENYGAVSRVAENSKVYDVDSTPVVHAQPEPKAIKEPEYVGTDQINLFAGSTSNSTDAVNTPFLSQQARMDHRIIGQVFATYWLVEYKKELYIIDQHAAHEKVLYERIIEGAANKTYSSQQLLPPIVLTLSVREQEVIRKYEEVLMKLGYEIEPFGGNEFSVRAVPADLYGLSEKDLILEFIDELAEEVTGGMPNPTAILEKVASLSCKAAVKANHVLSLEEANELIKELLTLENPYHCPHGRPVIVSMSQYELERKFKRIL